MVNHKSFFIFLVNLSLFSATYGAVNLTVNGLAVQIKNDFVELNFNSDSTILSLFINGTNIASNVQKGFYLDWSSGTYGMFRPSSIHIVEQSSSRVHFYWLEETTIGFDIELHYIMEDGLSGIYAYAKYMNNKDVHHNLGETRMVFRFKQNMLKQGTNSVRTGTIPNRTDLVNCTSPQDATYEFPNGTYYTKYDYAAYIRETHYQGVYGSGYGAFVISPSREYHGGGAMKQDITVHESSLITNYFASGHFGFPALDAPPGWKHIYGPFLIYFNTADDEGVIVSDAEKQVEIEKRKWPYSFVNDTEYPLERGSLSGYISGQKRAAVVAYDFVSQEYDLQQSGYLFTNQTDSNGYYEIHNIRPGTYRVVSYPLAGQGSENLAEANVTITAGRREQINFTLPEPENILWSLGEANRRSSEFNYSDQPRNFKWKSYPPATVNFTIGVSDPKTDWYYAQAQKGHWYINYQDTVDGRNRTLRVALAGASMQVHIQLHLNLNFTVNIYTDNDHAVYRSAMQSGKYHSYIYTIPSDYVVNGTNTVVFYSKGQIMYDAISLQVN